MNRRLVFAGFALALSSGAAVAVCLSALLLSEWPRLRGMGRSRRDVSLAWAFAADPRVRHLADALRANDPRTDVFKTLWDTDVSVALSRRMFREVDMDGIVKYAYKPGLNKLGFHGGHGSVEWKIETEDTPQMRAALRDAPPSLLVEASYDERGFRRVDPDLTAPCGRRVLFLGDSFTDGLWVGNGDTFVNVYGRIARQRGGARVCPLNAGVNGYGSVEERFVLEHDFDAVGRPSLVFLMYFANDVADDFGAVVDGMLPDADRLWRASLNELQRMHRFTRDRHSTLVVVAIPTKDQVLEHSAETHYQDVLRAFCAREGVMFLDPYEEFVRFDAETLYWAWDPHLTPAGHRVMAETLYERTKDLLQ